MARPMPPARRPSPPHGPPAPVAQYLVIRYAKRGRMRFASHRDIARAVERGVRKAGLPIAYSAGFSPHPKISYAGAAPTGTASEAEYLEIALTGACPAPDVRDRLDAALPDGIDVIEVSDLADAPGGIAALRLEGSQWQVSCPASPRTRQPVPFRHFWPREVPWWNAAPAREPGSSTPEPPWSRLSLTGVPRRRRTPDV